MIPGFVEGLLVVLTTLILGIGDPSALFFQLFATFIATFIGSVF